MIDYVELINAKDRLGDKLDLCHDNEIEMSLSLLETLIADVVSEYEKVKKYYTDVKYNKKSTDSAKEGLK